MQWSSVSSPAPAAAFFNHASPGMTSASIASSVSPAPLAAAANFVSKDVQKAARKKMTKQGTWMCTICTFQNKLTREYCEMCEAPNARVIDTPAVAAAKPSDALKPKLPTPAPVPAPAPVPLVSPVSQTFKTLAYENGIISACNNLTYDEVMNRRLIGLPRAQLDLIMKLKHRSSAIFLLNLESKELYGVFEAEGNPGVDIEPEAWSGQMYRGSARSSRFPAQCAFTIAADFESPLAERHYKELFGRDAQRKIRLLNSEEVKKLIKIFQTKSKLRKVPGSAAVASNVFAPTAAVPAVASASASNLAAAPGTGVLAGAIAPSSSTNAATPSSANSSRRGSVDSTVSDEERRGSNKKKTIKIQQTCKRWLADECSFSDETCRYLHVPSICRAFQRGTCPKGANCPFVHDKIDRENYRNGRAYCQKTAVHADSAGGASTGPSAASKAKTSTSHPKDSLDSILSGLGSWKIAPRKADASVVEEKAESNLNAALPSSYEVRSAGVNGVSVADEDHPLYAADDFSYTEEGDDGMTFEASSAASSATGASSSLFGGFDMGHVASSAAGAGGAGGWSSFAATAAAFHPGSASLSSSNPGESVGGGLFFSPQPQQAVAVAAAAPLPGSNININMQPTTNTSGAGSYGDDEFPWFTNFRSHVVQPAIQAMVMREQQTRQKFSGPD